MVTDLVDQHVADDAVHRLAGPGTVEKDPVWQTCGIRYAFERHSHAMIEPEQIIRIADVQALSVSASAKSAT